MEITEAAEHDHRPWWLRLRSAFLLTLLVLALGVTTAVLFGAAALAVTQALSRAIG